MYSIMRLVGGLQPTECEETEGQGLVEYALILLLVVMACFGALSAFGATMKTVFWDVIQGVLIPALGG